MKRALVASLCFLAAACQDAPPPPPEEEGSGAKGQVLEGTISDDMLPLDTIVVPQNVPDPGDVESPDGADTPAEAEQDSGAQTPAETEQDPEN